MTVDPKRLPKSVRELLTRHELPSSWASVDSGDPFGVAFWNGAELKGAWTCELAKLSERLPQRTFDRVVYELPDKVTKDPESILLCAARGGIVAARLAVNVEGIEAMPVRRWKGSQPKEVTKAWTFAALSYSERMKIHSGASHCWDAIGIGLKWLQLNGHRALT